MNTNKIMKWITLKIKNKDKISKYKFKTLLKKNYLIDQLLYKNGKQIEISNLNYIQRMNKLKVKNRS